MTTDNRPFVPEAFYACKNIGCAEQQTYPANMLFWCPVGSNWVCEDCVDDEGLETTISLASFLKERVA